MSPSYTKIFGLVNRWYNGEKVEGIETPTLETITELIDIASGACKGTINSDVVKVLDYCGISYKTDGIGWRVI